MVQSFESFRRRQATERVNLRVSVDLSLRPLVHHLGAREISSHPNRFRSGQTVFRAVERPRQTLGERGEQGSELT